MALKTYHLPYGKGTQDVALPEEHVLDVLEGHPTPACDIKEETLRAMRHPIGAEPLASLVHEGDKVCFVVADITRAWNHAKDFLPYVVDEVSKAGVPDEDMYIVFAQGTHRKHTKEEDLEVVGEEVASRIKLYQHDCHDQKNLVYEGTTSRGTKVWINRLVAEADKVILINAMSTHDMAGFGGGRKLILPGVAAWDTIQQNHCHALGDEVGSSLNPKAGLLKIKGNPVSEDMQEASDMVKPCFLVHSIINADGEVAGMIGGDPYKAWLEGTKIVTKMQKVPLKEKSDVVIVSAGGYPKDVNLYQGTKCYSAGNIAVKEGGIIIAMIESDEIMEPPAYMNSYQYDNLEDMEKALRQCFTIPFFVAYYNMRIALTHTMYLVTLPKNHGIIRKKTHEIPVASLQEAWNAAEKKLKEEGKTDYTIQIIPHGSAVVPIPKE
jgi:nickel-dependent lactate racemase